MSGPPPPPPPPGPPPPPAMAPQQLPKANQQGRSALLSDITKGSKLKSAKHLMNDRSGLPSSTGGSTGGRAPHVGGGGATGAGTVRNAPPGLGDLFGGGMPKLRGTGSNTVGRSSMARGGDRVSNGSVDFPPPPPPPSSSKHSIDSCDGAGTDGRSTGPRMGGGLPPPPSPSQLSRPLPNVPGLRPSGPPPPPTRGPPLPKAHANGPTSTQGFNSNRTLPPTPGPPPKPPERKDSVAPPPPPPIRVNNGPPPPPNRAPPVQAAPLSVRPGGGGAGRSGPPPGPPPPPGSMRTIHAPPPPDRPPHSVTRTNSTASASSGFEAMFQFPTDLPPPDPFCPSNKTYPSQNPNRKAASNTNRRPVPPPPPPGGP